MRDYDMNSYHNSTNLVAMIAGENVLAHCHDEKAFFSWTNGPAFLSILH